MDWAFGLRASCSMAMVHGQGCNEPAKVGRISFSEQYRVTCDLFLRYILLFFSPVWNTSVFRCLWSLKAKVMLSGKIIRADLSYLHDNITTDSSVLFLLISPEHSLLKWLSIVCGHSFGDRNSEFIAWVVTWERSNFNPKGRCFIVDQSLYK